ncbi:hypothetical protein CHGG_00586 [Chaetomium globosum CBS 148.51]|uniref:Uncharacterized protein n=1 Tax=Chaetomium globosum (strain ATCC 6205 / CBS 148.51 / DSM 1962 / NBRC 6347 / NRRL 1970) TaxID=306901 RepID=Q2HGR8_CHAGB|nr:uncharacterized protein CHGG_00586 [Chaetomium globosum CBS 148.51]EAQ92351.1 hypothetical protein CHGG_00586 [Chaetomium globosum CBS 148.51]
MAAVSATPWGAIIVAFSCTAFSDLNNAVLAAFSLIVREKRLFADFPGPVPPREALMKALGILIFAFLLLQLLRMRKTNSEAPRWNGFGKVLLFPCSTIHSRFFPKKHSFSYPYLLVGIPVGFEGNAGGMVSVKAKGKPGLFSITPWAGWFTVDAGDHLERGKSELGLRGKLDEYLQTQDVNPSTYPHAYLITAPRFLGYQFNPVCFWYLYDADKRLAAMIIEFNNTFSERRMYFLTADHSPAVKSKRSPHHNTHPPTFKEWPKDFHVSPFSSLKGSYTLTASDPLHHPPTSTLDTTTTTTTAPLTTTLTLLSSQSHPKLTATLTSTTAPLHPSAMTPTQKRRFLLSWWYVGLLTFPRILAQAAVLHFRHKLPVYTRPEPRRGTLSRPATRAERQLECVFRWYLARCVEVEGGERVGRLVVRYTAAGVWGGDGDACVFRSPEAVAAVEAGERVDELVLTVLTPAFYARFAARYTGSLNALVREACAGGTLWVSRPDLLARLIPAEENTAPLGLCEVLGLDGTGQPGKRLLRGTTSLSGRCRTCVVGRGIACRIWIHMSWSVRVSRSGIAIGTMCGG